MNQVTELKMAVDATFSSIISEIQLSNLNFSLQLTSFTAYITLKKSVIKDKHGNQAVPSPPILILLQQAQQTIRELQEENYQLKIKSDATEKKNDALVNENVALIEALDKNNKDLADSRATNNTLQVKLEEAENRIIEIRYEKNSLESNLNDIKRVINRKSTTPMMLFKTLEKGSKGLKKEIYNLNRNLENTRDTLKNLKSEHSSLR